jgi:putative hydrolase
MKFYADYHMHTKYSDGNNTLEEMAKSAQVKGLKEIAITDHGPKNIGVGVKNEMQYLEIKKETERVSDKLGIKVKCGAEANIISVDGHIDVSEAICKELDLLLVGLHPYIMPKDINTAYNFVLANRFSKHLDSVRMKVMNTNSKALVEAMHHYDVDIITHPNLGMPIDTWEVARACAETDTLFELNVGHKYQSAADVILASKQGARFVANSDAHYVETVGDLDHASKILAQAKIPLEDIANVQINE